MHVVVDTSEVERFKAQLRGAGRRITEAQGKAVTRVAEEAVGFIKREFRSGPTSPSTTQVRSNKLRSSYRQKVTTDTGSMTVKIGLLQGSVSGSVLEYGRLQEGLNPDGSSFSSKVIRAKSGGYLTFPIYRSNIAGVAKSNIEGWVRVRQVTFRPRPSFPGVIEKYAPLMQAAVGDAAMSVLTEVGK